MRALAAAVLVPTIEYNRMSGLYCGSLCFGLLGATPWQPVSSGGRKMSASITKDKPEICPKSNKVDPVHSVESIEPLINNGVARTITVATSKGFEVPEEVVVKVPVNAVHEDSAVECAPLPAVAGEPVLFTDNDGPRQIGPVFAYPICYDTKSIGSVVSAVTQRLSVKYKFKPTSKAAMDYDKAVDAMVDTWFTPARIERANADFSYDGSKPKKWSSKRMVDTLLRLNKEYNIKVPEAFIKNEIIVKTGKAPRIIINEGPERCVENLRMVYIVENVIFEQVAKEMNIKHQDKKRVFDEICKLHQRKVKVSSSMAGKTPTNIKTKDTTFIGIDQTSFDMSETYSEGDGTKGLLSAEMKIMMKILRVINPDEMDWMNARLSERESESKFNFVVEYCKGYQELFRIRTKRRRHSGDRGTSVFNWIVEFLSTVTSIFKYPEAVVKAIGNKRNWINHNGERIHWVFITRFVDSKGAPIYSSFWGLFEGDDGFIRVDQRLLDHISGIERNFNDLGLTCKLEFSKNKTYVVEVVGYHVLVHDGCLVFENGGAFMPMFNRSLIKSGWTLSKAALADVGKSYYLSKASEMQGKCKFLYDYFSEVAASWQSGRQLEGLDYQMCEDTDWLSEDTQLTMVLLSSGTEQHEVFGNYLSFDMSVTKDTKGSDIITMFPPGFQRAVTALTQPKDEMPPLVDDSDNESVVYSRSMLEEIEQAQALDHADLSSECSYYFNLMDRVKSSGPVHINDKDTSSETTSQTS